MSLRTALYIDQELADDAASLESDILTLLFPTLPLQRHDQPK